MVKKMKKNISNTKKTAKSISEKKYCQVSNNRLYDVHYMLIVILKLYFNKFCTKQNYLPYTFKIYSIYQIIFIIHKYIYIYVYIIEKKINR